MDCSLPGSSVHRILQARILEWVAISFSRASSWPKDWTQVSCIAGRFFTVWATQGSPLGSALNICQILDHCRARQIRTFRCPGLSFASRLSLWRSLLIFYSHYNKLSQAQWLKTLQFCCLILLEIARLKCPSLGKTRCWQGCIPFRARRGEPVFLSFPIDRGYHIPCLSPLLHQKASKAKSHLS